MGIACQRLACMHANFERGNSVTGDLQGMDNHVTAAFEETNPPVSDGSSSTSGPMAGCHRAGWLDRQLDGIIAACISRRRPLWAITIRRREVRYAQPDLEIRHRPRCIEKPASQRETGAAQSEPRSQKADRQVALQPTRSNGAVCERFGHPVLRQVGDLVSRAAAATPTALRRFLK
ncbi:hypothetical protein DVH05_009216 [Phytophthora capsici]|nr:hypothetical protein DVH05_009216 [Phytophthora capsici]